MQIRRPVCLFSLIFVLLVLGCMYGRELPGMSGEPFPAEGEHIVLTGIVKQKEYRVMYGEKIPVLYVSDVKDKKNRQVMCYIKDAGKETVLPRMGETVRVSGKVSLFREASNPGEFNLKEYYQILRISYKLNQAEILACSASYIPLKEKLFQMKCSCCGVLEKIYPAKEASLLKAMLLGEKNGLEEEIKELYRLNGLIHILAISGLHISLIGTAVSGILKKCGMPLWLRAPAAIGLMWCYGVMTGMGVSTWRAVFMFSMRLAAELSGRTYDMLTALSLAAFLMLAEQPLFVKHSGFLLSFGAAAGIGIVLPWWKEVLQGMAGRKGDAGEKDKTALRKGRKPAADRLGEWRRKGYRAAAEGFRLGTAIAVATLPVLLYFSYRYPVYSLILNLYVVPLMGVVFAVGMASMAAGFLLPAAGILSGMPGRLILQLYEISCREALKLPGAASIAGRPKPWQIMAYYGILCGMIFRHHIAEEKTACKIGKQGDTETAPALIRWLLTLGGLWLLLLRPCSGFSVTFLDVGQGDCIVMRNENGNCYMVDGGSTSRSKVGKYSMLPYLESEGIGELEAVFLTHPDEDHISGVLELMEQSGSGVRINCLILADVSRQMKEEELFKLRRQAAEHAIPIRYIGRGDMLRDRELKISCLGPERGSMTDEVNEMSTVLLVEYGEFRMLLTGDVTGEPERELLAELAEREPLTVLKVAHHGSKYSTPGELLELTDPVYAVISAGRDNPYGHPHEELMERLERQGCHIFQTAESGALTFKVRRGKIRVEEFLGGNSLTKNRKEIK